VLQRATDLNEAYRVLRSDAARASYLLKLQGIDLDKEGGGADQPRATPAFLMEILELREALAEAKAGGDEARVRGLDSDVRGRSERTTAAIAAAFLRAEAGERAALPEIAAHLIALRYYQRFHDEIEAYEEARLSS
jgi:molecular chaperone HscB